MRSSPSILATATVLVFVAALGTASVRAEVKAEPMAVTTENGKTVRLSPEARKSRAFFWLFMQRDQGTRIAEAPRNCGALCSRYLILGISF